MSVPTITSITTVQGTGGSLPSISCVDVHFTLATTGSVQANVAAQISINGATGPFYPCTLLSTANGQSLNPGSGLEIQIDVESTFAANAVSLAAYSGTNAMIQLRATDTNSLVSAWINGIAFTLKSTRPTVTSALMAQYVGAGGLTGTFSVNAPFVISSSTDGVHYRVSEDLSAVSPGGSAAFHTMTAGSATASYTFVSTEANGYKQLWLKTYDQYYNESVPVSVTWTTSGSAPFPLPWWQPIGPIDCIATLVGTVGNSYYTGITINDDLTFTPNRQVSVQAYALSPIPFYYRIETSGDVESTPNTNSGLAANVGVNILYNPADASSAIRNFKVVKTKSTPANDDYNVDALCTVNVTFTDAAGNSAAVFPSPTIWLNTRTYQAAHTAIITDNTHSPLVREITISNADVQIPQTMILPDVVVRRWNEIFYPTTHGWPINSDGSLNTDYVFAPITVLGTTYTVTDSGFQVALQNKMMADGFDPVDIVQQVVAGTNTWVLVTDGDGRVTTSPWTKDGTKNYGNMLSSSPAFLKSWVLDNSGNGDFAVEFEYFDLNSNIYGPPYNPIAPQKGDMLVIYDASDPASIQIVPDATGKTSYQIADSTRLIQLMAFTGSGTSVIDLVTGLPVGANPDGAFTTSTFKTTPKIAIIFYSDANGTGSGFKIKAGKKEQVTWTNFDIDPIQGRFWIHKQATFGTANGAADTTSKVLTYSYQQGSATVDFETGQVTFGTAPSGVITADFSYYTGDGQASNLFISSFDDFVAYQGAPVYAGQAGAANILTADKSRDFNDPAYQYGRLITGSQWDTDRGILTLTDVALGSQQRLFADYYYHTYTRLTSDGHGDMVFVNSIMVAASTTAYPDFTWGDLKIVNEGDATLEQGIVNFGFRGYDTNQDGKPEFDAGSQATDTADRVLDVNRPWDIQEGTAAETFSCLGMAIFTDFIWNRNCPRPPNGTSGPDNLGVQPVGGDPTLWTSANVTAIGILANWKAPPIPTLAAQSQVFGRLVWVLCGSGSSYPSAVSSGKKKASLEIAGQFFNQLVI